MQPPLSRKEALDILLGPGVFSVEWTTRDKKRNRQFSKHMHFERAVNAGANHNLVQHRQIGVRPVDDSHSQVAIAIPLIERVNGRYVL